MAFPRAGEQKGELDTARGCGDTERPRWGLCGDSSMEMTATVRIVGLRVGEVKSWRIFRVELRRWNRVKFAPERANAGSFLLV